MMNGFYGSDFIKPVVRALLIDPDMLDWSVQGMGMMRCYLPVEQPGEGTASMRLHIWDDSLQVPNVSRFHTHPWDMESHVVAGELENDRFIRVPVGSHWREPVQQVWEQDLRPGEGGGLVAEPKAICLLPERTDTVVAGGSYTQRKDEIHVSRPLDGTVTLVYRVVRPGDDPDHAFTFWPAEDGPDGWVSAEPRPATWDEIARVTANAVDKWF